jgi:hypothetical protein
MHGISRLVLPLGTALCLWVQLSPFGWTRRLQGVAVGPGLAAVFLLALAWVHRRTNERADRLAFEGAGDLVRLAGRATPLCFVVLALALCSISGPQLSLLWPASFALGWLATGRTFVRVERADGDAPRAALVTGVIAAVVSCALLVVTRAPTLGGTSVWTPVAVLPLAVVVAVDVLAPHAPEEKGLRILWKAFAYLTGGLYLFLALLGGGLAELPQDLDYAEFLGLPFCAVALWLIGTWARRVAAALGRLDESTGNVRVFGPVMLGTRTWQFVLAAQLAYNLVGGLYWPLVAAVLLVGFGTLARLELRASSRFDPTELGWALVPWLAPLVAFAALHLCSAPDEWTSKIASHGQVAALFEALPVPLLGAALLCAWRLDRNLWAGAFGLTFLGVSVAAALAPESVDLLRGVRWLGEARFITQLEAKGLAAHGFLAGGAGLGIAVVASVFARLRALERNARVLRWPLAVGASTTLAASLLTVPSAGPVAVLWAAAGSALLTAAIDFSTTARAV